MNTPQLLKEWLRKRYRKGELLVIARTIIELLDDGEAAEDSAEAWLDFPGYEGLYEISSHRRVRRAASGQGTWGGRVLKQRSQYGDMVVSLSEEGRSRTVSVSDAYCRAFLGDLKP